jgi:hypothetical protein
LGTFREKITWSIENIGKEGKAVCPEIFFPEFVN